MGILFWVECSNFELFHSLPECWYELAAGEISSEFLHFRFFGFTFAAHANQQYIQLFSLSRQLSQIPI